MATTIIPKKKKNVDESDPKIAFKKLEKLQMTLKEEIALTDIFFENREILLKKIEENCILYYKNRIAIQGLYDQATQDKTDSKTKINYVVSPDAEKELSQCFDAFNKLMFYLRDSNKLTLSLIENCKKESYEQLANFICNYYYVNIFSSTFLNENLLTLIYLLLEKEINSLNDEKTSFFAFLDSSKSFTAVLLKCLSRHDEIKSFLENILKKILIKTAGLLGNQRNIIFTGFEIHKINDFLNLNKYLLPKTMKTYDSLNYLLESDIKKSRLNIMKEFAIIKNTKQNEEDKTQLSKDEIENNFYVQATKETFDNLVLGNEDEEDELFNMNEEENNQKKNNTVPHKKKKGGEDDIELFLINSGYYSKISKDNNQTIDEKQQKEKEFFEKNHDKIFNDFYLKELNKDILSSELENEQDNDMKSYIGKQISNLEKNSECCFNNNAFINDVVTGLSGTKIFLEKIILIYKYNFEVIKSFIDELLTALIKNKDNTPYIIRAICTIISKLLQIKFPNITNLQINSFISEFLFSNLIIPILFNPTFNGILMYDFNKKKINNLRYPKIVAITKIIKKLLRAELYDSSKKNEINYTIFNSYFIEIMPHLIDYYRNISSTKLPINIEKLIDNKKNNINERDIEYNFLKFHPEERLEHQSMCLSWKEIVTIYEIMKTNVENIFPNKEDIVYKTYNKLTFHEKTFLKKIDNDSKESKKTYMNLSKLIFDDKLKEKINAKKDKKFSFQSNETVNNDTENFALSRIKYCINTIIKHLNTLSRNNFFVDGNENFTDGLNKMIGFEGFSEMLREKSLPLEWFGLYLKSNIENIPDNYKNNNFCLLFDELIEESKKNLLIIQNDNSLNTIYTKLINSEKMIDICKNNLKRIKNNEKKFEILDFILETNIPIVMLLYNNNENKISNIQIKSAKEDKVKEKFESQALKEKKKLNAFNCKTILEFCNKFPNLTETVTLDILELEENIKLKEALNEYFIIILETIKDVQIFKDYTEEEKTYVKVQIEDFIHTQIYNKIFNERSIPNDIKIFSKCYRLGWIQPTMIDPDLTYLDEKITQMIISFIRNLDNENSPNNKLREFEKIDLLINNFITLYGYSENLYFGIMAYAFIKGQPRQLESNYKYIKMYFNGNSFTKKKNLLIKKFEELINKIQNFTENDLVGVSKDDFNKNCNNAVSSGNNNKQ